MEEMEKRILPLHIKFEEKELVHEDWCEDPNCTHREKP